MSSSRYPLSKPTSTVVSNRSVMNIVNHGEIVIQFQQQNNQHVDSTVPINQEFVIKNEMLTATIDLHNAPFKGLQNVTLLLHPQRMLVHKQPQSDSPISHYRDGSQGIIVTNSFVNDIREITTKTGQCLDTSKILIDELRLVAARQQWIIEQQQNHIDTLTELVLLQKLTFHLNLIKICYFGCVLFRDRINTLNGYLSALHLLAMEEEAIQTD